jgi:hypothetical protein
MVEGARPPSPAGTTNLARNWQRRTLKLSKRLEAAGRPKGFDFKRASIQPHLHRDPDQVRMILGAKLLLEQRGGVGHRLV